MTALLRRTTMPMVSAGAVDRAMKTLRLNGARRDKGTRITIPAKDALRAGDLLDRDFTAEAPNRLGHRLHLCEDLGGVVYVAFILDCFAQRDRGPARLDEQGD